MKTTFVVMVLSAVVVLAALIAWPEWFGPLEMAVLVLFSVGLAAFVCGKQQMMFQERDYNK